MKTFSSKTAAALLSLGMLVGSFTPLVAQAVNNNPPPPASITIDTINGQVPNSNVCINSPATIDISGVTGSQGGSYSVNINWGDGSAVQSINLTPNPIGKEASFSLSLNHVFLTNSSSIGLFLYHGQTGGQDANADASKSVSVCIVVPPPANHAPVANPLSISTNQNTATSSLVKGSDADAGDTITFATSSNPTHGTVTGFSGATGAFTYTPVTGYTGSDSFQFVVIDNHGATSTAATVSITVNAAVTPPVVIVNHAPVANALSISTAQNTATSSKVTASDVDAGDMWKFATSTNPAHGALAAFNSVTGAFTYVPAASSTSPDSFKFVAIDNHGATSTPATVSITVTAATSSTPAAVLGCTNASATNYNAAATQDDGSCVLPAAPVTPPSNGGGGGGGGGGVVIGGPLSIGFTNKSNGGVVLGTSTEATPDCNAYLTAYIRKGKQNDAAQVVKLQQFLNNLEGSKLAVTGTYDAATLAAINSFQSKYAKDVLTPWGASQPTGYVYYTTQKEVNTIYCRFTKQFPLSGDQLSEIARIKGLGEPYNPGVVLGASTSNPVKQASTSINAADKPASTTGATASTTGAKRPGSFWSKVTAWLLHR